MTSSSSLRSHPPLLSPSLLLLLLLLQLKASWRIFDEVLHQIDRSEVKPDPYEYGSRGPPAADVLRSETGHVTNIVAKDITWSV